MISSTACVASRSLRVVARQGTASAEASGLSRSVAPRLAPSVSAVSRLSSRPSASSSRLAPWPRSFSSCHTRLSDKSPAAADAAASSEGDKAKKAAEESSNKEQDTHAAALNEKDAKIKELNDALLYARADMQNLMRRSTEDKANASDYAITKLARDLTSSLDILQIALRSVPDSLRKASGTDGAADEDPRRVLVDLYSGLELTERSLLDMLKSHGVTEFDPTGEKFDPALHEALYQAPVPGKTPGTVLECQKRGYKIKNRVLRPAQVGVVQSTE